MTIPKIETILFSHKFQRVNPLYDLHFASTKNQMHSLNEHRLNVLLQHHISLNFKFHIQNSN